MAAEPTLKLLFFGLILFAIVLEAAADILFKYWSIENKNSLFILGMLAYAVGTVFWAVSLKYEFLSKAVSVFTILNLAAIVLLGVLVFKENLSLINKIGIVLGVVSIILIEI